ncbi:MAG: transcriptional regulator [Natronomonas sp.]
MSDFTPEPDEATLTAEREDWTESQDTQERIRAVITGLQEPATAATIAERAACSTNAARKHLDTFVALGVVRKREDSRGARYVRNDAYFRWRRANELAETHTIEELLDAVADLETQIDQFQQQFDATTPADVEFPEEATHAELEDRLEALSRWETLREAIDRHREAIRISRHDGGKLTA